MTIEEFYNNFNQEIIAKSGAEENFYEDIFLEHVCDFLVEQAIISNYTPASFKKTQKGLKVDGWDYNDDEGILTLFVCDYRFDKNLQTITQTELNKDLARARSFFVECNKATFCASLEESSPAFELAMEINKNKDVIKRVKILLLTNAQLSKKITSLDKEDYKNIEISYDVWDLSRIYRIETSGKAKEDIEIDFTSIIEGGLRCLPAFNGSNICESYLFVMPAAILAQLYDEYGERLLEQNVRTFLQFRGGVNKGIRNTLLNEPEMFFAYNNGLTTTAEKVETSEDGTFLHSVKNFQIVNGGQTTASIFTANRKNKADLEKVFVQVKLSVVNSSMVDAVIPRISEYANTQNKVSAADFFSNHPFHLRIEEHSRQIWAPSSDGSIMETHWFYERARGQYGNAQNRLTPGQTKEFLTKFPKNQMFTKTDLAKYENSFLGLPHIVSKGAQKNFAAFASSIGSRWEGKDTGFNELYFREIIAKAIIFKGLDKAIMKASWYSQGYKANIVTYTLAKFADMVASSGDNINFELIWGKQKLDEKLENQLLHIAKAVNEAIQSDPPEGTNITEWCKREICWQKIKKLEIDFLPGITDYLISKNDYQMKQREAKTEQVLTNGITSQLKVLNKGYSYWEKLKEWAKYNPYLTPKELSILNVAAQKGSLVSEHQADVLLKAEERAVREGFFVK
ncbi:MAG: hypothetical protein CVV42_08940 [Candidatus Riflebacteria bacterium HGW-Riflebacteria-2]|nr:MAG: hypothetical protein CVV42_08940 [Candidatus Riflebacteria bacterium HGW-Riflebacteria-2]